MEESLDDYKHPHFTYIYIPDSIDEDVQLREFEGKERDFKNRLRTDLCCQKTMTAKQKEAFRDSVKGETDSKIGDDLIQSATESTSGSYEIIPLVLPNPPRDDFNAINGYIDSVGRLRDLPPNARASRLTSTEIYGPCVISRTFDNDEDFTRVDFDISDYEKMLENPPDSKGRWSQSQAAQKMLKTIQAQDGKALEAPRDIKHACGNCGKVEGTLSRCQRCKKVLYCTRECQKEDWKFHKRICN
eukprot:GHVO01023256.1.p1 GENE.GHVO01023256.1~~GHVO01023256.1.p1  ORF type:complete len:244 (+),score=51.34 GHVO01023256.1:423-1154(+)